MLDISVNPLQSDNSHENTGGAYSTEKKEKMSQQFTGL